MSEHLSDPIISSRMCLNTCIESFIQYQYSLSSDDERWRAIENNTFVTINQFLNEAGVGFDDQGMDLRLGFAKNIDEHLRNGINPIKNSFDSHDILDGITADKSSSTLLSEEYLQRFAWAAKVSQAIKDDDAKLSEKRRSSTAGNFDANISSENNSSSVEYYIKPFSAVKKFIDKNKRRIAYSASILATAGVALFGINKITTSNEDSFAINNPDAPIEDVTTSTTFISPDSSVTTKDNTDNPSEIYNDSSAPTTLPTVGLGAVGTTEFPAPNVTNQDTKVPDSNAVINVPSNSTTTVTRVDRGDNLWNIIESNIVRTDLTQRQKQVRVLAAIDAVKQDNEIDNINVIYKGQTIKFSSAIIEQLNA